MNQLHIVSRFALQDKADGPQARWIVATLYSSPHLGEENNGITASPER
jgi:hypothetical protein